ncbi:hypothetical protein [Bradyrhizobium sp.]|uniref:hypothetical protein n=1 Tax=Bradyrhizobium sp. TaxID=376 RepID=UPI002E04737B|nr:hypothetical protein [Bradyrhizobium sp.]
MTGLGAAEAYLDDAKHLRAAMNSNRDDSTFADGGGRTVYIVDANIVLLFIKPSKHIHLLRPFQRWLEGPVLVTNSTLMAEFVFSGNLPGQSGPIYMSKPHFEEVIYNSEKIQNDVAKSIAATGPIVAESFDVQQLTTILRDTSATPETKVEALTSKLPPEITRLVQEEGEWAAGVQFKRLFQQPQIVRRIDSAEWFELAFDPDPNHILEWYKRLLPFRTEKTSTPKATKGRLHDGGGNPASMIKLYNDASTLATLELLSRSTPEQSEDTRYLLITADRAIRQAVDEFVKSPAGAGLRDFTRHVREFTPLLNLSAIAEPDAARFQDRKDIFEKIRLALDELLLEADKGNSALQGTHHPQLRRITEDEVSKKIEGLKQHWSDSAAIAASLALPLIRPRYGAYFDALAEALTDREVVGDVLGGLLNIFTDLRQLHAQMTFQGSLISARQAARSHATKSKAKLRPRAPMMLIDIDFSPFIGNESHDQYLGRVARGEIPDYPLSDYPENAEIGFKHLFHAWLLTAVELWPQGRAHSGLAVRSYERDNPLSPILDEALYCHAVTGRFTMASARDYRVGIDLLGKALERTNRHTQIGIARYARALSERAAHRLFALQHSYYARKYLATSRGNEFFSDPKIGAILAEGEMKVEFGLAIADLRAVERDWIEDHEPYLKSEKLKVFSHELKLQVYSNIASAWVFRDDVSGTLSLPDAGSDRADDLAQLNQVIDDDVKQYGSENKVAILNQALLAAAEAAGDVREHATRHAISLLQNSLEASKRARDPLNFIERLECEAQLDRLRAGVTAA